MMISVLIPSSVALRSDDDRDKKATIARLRSVAVLVGLAGWLVSCASSTMLAIPHESVLHGEEGCASLAGEYAFRGTVEADGQEAPISFLERLARPSRRGVQWVRISESAGSGQFSVSFVDRTGDAVGKDVLIVAQCINGMWEERRSHEANSDGTFVKGTRVWRYLPEPKGMTVEYQETAISQYFPGLLLHVRCAA